MYADELIERMLLLADIIKRGGKDGDEADELFELGELLSVSLQPDGEE